MKRVLFVVPVKPKRKVRVALEEDQQISTISTQTSDDFYRQYYERKLAVEAEKKKRQHDIVTRAKVTGGGGGGAEARMDATKINIEANHGGNPGGGDDDGGGKHGYASGILNTLFGGVSF